MYFISHVSKLLICKNTEHHTQQSIIEYVISTPSY